MLRLILLLLLLLLAGWMLPRLLRMFRAGPRGSTAIGHMVRCARCATFFPADDAVYEAGQAYCCEAHRRQGPAGPP